MRRDPSSTKYLAALVVVGLSAACGDGTGPEVQDPTISVVSGSGQSAMVGQAVANPLVVRVARGSAGVAGTSVSWSVIAGGGSVTPTTSLTDNAGTASTTWTLGPNAGANTLEAAAAGATGSPVTFSATGTAVGPPPSQAAVSVGDNFFDPATQTVAVGGSITWTWGGVAMHNVTFASGTNSATQSSGDFTRSFPTAGTFDYQCTIHGAVMSGTIVVQ